MATNCSVLVKNFDAFLRKQKSYQKYLLHAEKFLVTSQINPRKSLLLNDFWDHSLYLKKSGQKLC